MHGRPSSDGRTRGAAYSRGYAGNFIDMTSPRSDCAGHRGKRRGGIIPQSVARLPDTPSVDVHARGRSPGLRVAASVRLPKAFAPQWLCRTNARRLQLRGQLRIVAAIMAAPDSRLSFRPSRIGRTSNTRYSRRGKKCVNSYDRLGQYRLGIKRERPTYRISQARLRRCSAL